MKALDLCDAVVLFLGGAICIIIAFLVGYLMAMVLYVNHKRFKNWCDNLGSGK
jgi:hypothetical protein